MAQVILKGFLYQRRRERLDMAEDPTSAETSSSSTASFAEQIVGLQSALWNAKQFKVVDDHFSADVVGKRISLFFTVF